MNTQFRKGAIEMCVLALIGHRDRYGYELVQAIARYTEINEGTIYPILRRLTQEGNLSTYLVESDQGPARKYYHITATGEQHLNQLKEEWFSLSNVVVSILRGEEQDDQR